MPTGATRSLWSTFRHRRARSIWRGSRAGTGSSFRVIAGCSGRTASGAIRFERPPEADACSRTGRETPAAALPPRSCPLRGLARDVRRPSVDLRAHGAPRRLACPWAGGDRRGRAADAAGSDGGDRHLPRKALERRAGRRGALAPGRGDRVDRGGPAARRPFAPASAGGTPRRSSAVSGRRFASWRAHSPTASRGARP